jgi:cytochrome c553
MRQSVETHWLGIVAPPLDDSALVLRGAGHYATGGAPCHGARGQPRSRIAAAMTPPPPFLPTRANDWDPSELFWIVRHGVKFTGMPAWVAPERIDEVWAVVALLLRLPELTPDQYRDLTLGELAVSHSPTGLGQLADPLQPVLDDCARCHGRDGAGRGEGAFPRLAGQSAGYLLASLQAYAAGDRRSGIMQPVAAGLSEPEMRRLSDHYAAMPMSSQPPADGDALGAMIAQRGVAGDGIPACAACHRPDGRERYPQYPSLCGQPAAYLAGQLRLFQRGARGGTAYAPVMEAIARRVNDAQIDAVAAHFAACRPPAGQTG